MKLKHLFKFALILLVSAVCFVAADVHFGWDILACGSCDTVFGVSMALVPIIAGDREAAIKAKLRERFPSMSDQKVTPNSFLRRMVPTSNSSGSYDFNFNQTNQSGTALQTEELLPLTDTFLVTRLRYYLTLVVSTTPGAFVPQFYPNNQVFTTTATATAAQFNAFWNGKLILTSGQVVNKPIDTEMFRYQPFLEQSSATTYSSYQQGAGFIEVSPFFLNGNYEQFYTLKVNNTGITDVVAGAANTTAYIVLEAHGFRLFNMAEFFQKSTNMANDCYTLEEVKQQSRA